MVCQNPQLTDCYALRLVTTRLSSSVGNFITGNRCGSVTGLVVSMVTCCQVDVNYSKRSRLSSELNTASFRTTVYLISDPNPSFITNTYFFISKLGYKLRTHQGWETRHWNKRVPVYPKINRVKRYLMRCTQPLCVQGYQILESVVPIMFTDYNWNIFGTYYGY
jgi:hypothetical protein